MSKGLSEFDITETIYNTGVKNFTQEELNYWIGREPIPFLNKYVDNPDGKIERSPNTLELYYNGVDFKDNFKDILFGNDRKFGRIELARAPLFDRKTNKKIGMAQFECTENIFESRTYVTCYNVYYIYDIDFIPEKIKLANDSSLLKNKFGSVTFKDAYLSRPGQGTFFVAGDYHCNLGTYSLENGLNKTSAIITVFLPFNSPEKKRSVIVNFDTIKSNNFLPQENYGVDKLQETVSNVRINLKKLL